MLLTRREVLAAPLAVRDPKRPAPWTSAWDRAVIAAAVDDVGASFDPAEALLVRKLGAEYRYHTNLRNTAVHPTRDSLEYAALLLEAGDDRSAARAASILDRLLCLQETDPGSKWYGLWGYYLEEPAHRMSPADWNWADFLGALLLVIEFRCGRRLPGPLRERVRQAIGHAASSVRRRNVAMTYTNIAAQGTFVTLAAAELLADADLLRYAKDRLIRFARTVDETGSFAEYNSPAYANVTIANLTRIRMLVKDESGRELARRIEDRAWLHVGKHWHDPTRQLAGPMSRCYVTDIGRPVWIQKALGGAVSFVAFEDLPSAKAPGEVGVLDYRCPEALSGLFLSLGASRQHREWFLAAPPDTRPVQGTTWLAPHCSIGSVNRGNFWIQSRPLVAYWGGAERPARYVQARVLKDDYDFASALLYSVQEKGYVLGLVTFRYPGGDKHPSLDPVKDAQFTCSRLRLRFDVGGAPVNAPILVNGKPQDEGEFPPGSRIAIDLGEVFLWLHSGGAGCGEPAGRVTVAREDGLLAISVDLLNTRTPRVIRWPQIAYAQFDLAMSLAGFNTLENFDLLMLPAFVRQRNETISLEWRTQAGVLGLEGPAWVGEVAAMDRAFRETLNGKAIPIQRLSDERLAPSAP